jgi:hypothetical protein
MSENMGFGALTVDDCARPGVGGVVDSVSETATGVPPSMLMDELMAVTWRAFMPHHTGPDLNEMRRAAGRPALVDPKFFGMLNQWLAGGTFP